MTFHRLPAVRARYGNMSIAGIYKAMAEGRFPRLVRSFPALVPRAGAMLILTPTMRVALPSAMPRSHALPPRRKSCGQGDRVFAVKCEDGRESLA
jgi:hypothetical protein